MNTKGRPKSQNIDDRRAYFGSMSVDPDYWHEDRNADFLQQSLLAPQLTAPPQSFSGHSGPLSTMTLEELLALLAGRNAPPTGMDRYHGILRSGL